MIVVWTDEALENLLIGKLRVSRHVGQYVVRGATCAEKIQYNPATDTVIWTASTRGFYKGKSETFKGFEFIDQLVAHLPPRRVQLVRRYGVYAGKVRKQWQERPGIYRLAPESWKQAHPAQSQAAQETRQEAGTSPEAPDAWSTKLRRQSWARLLQKVYRVDPLICPMCQGTMSVVAIIEDPQELAKIIQWAQKHEREPPSSVSALAAGTGTFVGIKPRNAAYTVQDKISKTVLTRYYGGALSSGCTQLCEIHALAPQ